MNKFEVGEKVQPINDRDGYGHGEVVSIKQDSNLGAVYWVDFDRVSGWFPESFLQSYGLGIQHYIGPPGPAVVNSTFVCGADAVGRRSSRNDTDPTITTCTACKQTSWWQDAIAEATK